ncbi:MerR family transcriptional regulator [uncultured Brevundimonas sp.]|uniref:MerR family transcriptional regulator n=1 Tax=uncultured Brevundimonas sp. TaxID=213418 RepID=UPI0025CD5C0A|nr:MerR family transcriptional regulator [uncultured Brevundimonas sp.]
MPRSLRVLDSAPAIGLSIGELSRELGVTVRALRHYEDAGILKPRRIKGGRVYDAGQRRKAQAVVVFRELGMSVPAIREILNEAGSGVERRRAIGAFCRRRLVEVERLATDIRRALDQLENPSHRSGSLIAVVLDHDT